MDAATRKIALILLGLVALCVVIGSIILTSDDKTIPDTLIALGGVAVGAVAGIVAPSKGE